MSKTTVVLAACLLAMNFACSKTEISSVDLWVECVDICDGIQCGTVDECVCGTCREGETCGTNSTCVPADAEPACLEQCATHGWECGDAYPGCKCGSCPLNWWCTKYGQCESSGETPCTPSCGTKQCGEDGCGGSCGECPSGQACQAGECVDETVAAQCQEKCAGLECGDIDDCNCGTCAAGKKCDGTGKCVDDVDPCADACVGKECGDDGCGGSCGSCAGQTTCVEGQCQSCEPDCAWKECGNDGCGGTCGSCGQGEKCAWDSKCYGNCNVAAIIGDDIQKVTYMDIGKGGHQGQGIDIDHNSDSCAPDGDCSGGIDNQISSLADGLQNEYDPTVQLEIALEDGDFIILWELVNADFSGKPFVLAMYIGDTVVDKSQCNYQSEKCDYEVDAESFNMTQCMPLASLDNATVVNNHLTAGGKEYSLGGTFPLGDISLSVTLEMVHVEGNILWDQQNNMEIVNGLLGAAIAKETLIESIEKTPAEDLPIDKEMVITLIDMLIVNDVDSDGDGAPDVASIGIKFDSIPGAVVGLKQ